MIKLKDIMVKADVIEDVICDICGHSCRVETESGRDQFEYMVMNTTWGFYSNKDMQEWTAHVCETCVDHYLVMVNFQKKDALSGKLIKK